LFNLLSVRIDFSGIHVLDLYAGSGALGLEALSRGAASAVFVESDARAAAVIEQNIAALGVRGAAVSRSPVGAMLAAEATRPADLVLADPPYDVANSEVERILVALADRGWVTHGTVAVIERPASGPEIRWPAGWLVWKARRYGDTRLEMAAVVTE
jgi:16S rRNA (guanine(966)-N(2))-methyltransferase RsmD